MIIRQALLDDKKALWEFIRFAYRQEAVYKLPDRWEWEYSRNPLVKPEKSGLPVWLVLDGERIVGQHCAIPIELKLGVHKYPAVWGTDLIIDPAYRGQHLALRLSEAICAHYRIYLAIIMAQASRHMFEHLGRINLEPVQVYRKFLRLKRESVVKFLIKKTKRRPILNRFARIGCRYLLFDRIFPLCANVALSLRDLFIRKSDRNLQTEICEIERFGDEIDRLWESTHYDFSLITRRDHQYLNWRFVDEPRLHYRRFLAMRDGQVKGYLVLRKPEPEELDVGMITELYASRRDEETIEALLQHAVAYFGKDVAAIEFPTTVAEYAKRLSRLGFIRMEEEIPLLICADPAIIREFKEARWGAFFSRGDQDWDQLRPFDL